MGNNRVSYKPNSGLYENYYRTQVGNGLPVFVGSARSMRGRGLGNILGGLARSVLPLIKSGGRALLNEGASSGLNVIKDVLGGSTLKASARRRAQESGSRLYNKAMNTLSGSSVARRPPPGEPAYKRAKKATRPSKKKKKRTAKKSGRRMNDIFG